ncbi:MAG: glycosyltransferase family protein [Bacteroidia bacterium]
MNNQTQQRILVAPLDWGLGHATRCVPVIRALRSAGAEVIIAADGRSYYFLQDEFPDIPLVRLPGYSVTYPRSRYLTLNLLLQSPRILKQIHREHKLVNELVAEYKIDTIISDNRFACRSEETYNIYITHQLHIKAPVAGGMATRIHRNYYERFDEIWVPDFKGDLNLSGELSHKIRPAIPTHFIGPLSRFSKHTETVSSEESFILILLSGPEPQRSLLEDILIQQFKSRSEKIILVRGITETNESREIRAGFLSVDHAASKQLETWIRQAKVVIARSGYSTLCDLAVFGKKLIAIPTPGQTEQEYLAHLHSTNKRLVFQTQADFSWSEFADTTSLPILSFQADNTGLLQQAIERLMRRDVKQRR